MRGDVHRLGAAGDARGHGQSGSRYAVVVQSDMLAVSTVLVAPTSASAGPATFRPEVTVAGGRTRVLVEQTVAVDPSRLGPPVGHLLHDELRDVEEALREVLDLLFPP